MGLQAAATPPVSIRQALGTRPYKQTEPFQTKDVTTLAGGTEATAHPRGTDAGQDVGHGVV